MTHVVASEIVSCLILFGLPFSIWTHNLELGCLFWLIVVLITGAFLLLDDKYSTVAPFKKLRAEKILETFLTYLFIIEVELGFVIIIETLVLDSYTDF
jgi:hypothetical protein